jgi:ER membrane protein complex subunit 7
MSLLIVVPLFAFLLRFCCAASLIISIPASASLPNPNTLSAYTHATLFSGAPSIAPITVPLTTRSTLEFHDLPTPNSSSGPQSFLLTISAPSHVFASYRVDVSSEKSSNAAIIEGIWETFPGSEWSEKGPVLGGKTAQGEGADPVDNAHSVKTTGEAAQLPQQIVQISAKVLSKREFYEERPGFNPLGLLMNPMVLLGVVALGITFGMPYLMDNRTPSKLPIYFAIPPPFSPVSTLKLTYPPHFPRSMKTVDPELRAELEEHKKSSPFSNMLQQAASGAGGAPGGSSGGFDLASWMAGAQKSPLEGFSSGTDAKDTGTATKRK